MDHISTDKANLGAYRNVKLWITVQDTLQMLQSITAAIGIGFQVMSLVWCETSPRALLDLPEFSDCSQDDVSISNIS